MKVRCTYSQKQWYMPDVGNIVEGDDVLSLEGRKYIDVNLNTKILICIQVALNKILHCYSRHGT